jgi:hypothetical protein
MALAHGNGSPVAVRLLSVNGPRLQAEHSCGNTEK